MKRKGYEDEEVEKGTTNGKEQMKKERKQGIKNQ